MGLGKHIAPLMAYIRLATWFEFFGMGVFWVILVITAIALRATGSFLVLVLPGLHFAGPFAALEMRNFFEEKWLKEPRVIARYDAARWIAQCMGVIVSDGAVLAANLIAERPLLIAEGLAGFETMLAVFFAFLFTSSILLTIAMVSVYISMNDYMECHPDPPKKDSEDARLLDAMRGTYVPASSRMAAM